MTVHICEAEGADAVGVRGVEGLDQILIIFI